MARATAAERIGATWIVAESTLIATRRVPPPPYPFGVIATSALLLERDRAFGAVTRALGVMAWPEVSVRWNRRLRRAGRAVIERRRGNVARATIELSPSYFEVYPEDLHGILVHEGVHVGLALLGLPFGHSPTFRAACERAGGRQHSRDMPGRVYRYRCPVCEAILDRRRRPGGDRWCARCARDAECAGTPPFLRGRALLLVGVAFQSAEARTRPAPDSGPVAPSEHAHPARDVTPTAPTAPSIDNPSAPWCRSPVISNAASNPVSTRASNDPPRTP